MEWLADPNIWISLITLTVLEIVLGIDNIIFISILAGKLPQGEQKKARTIGLLLALITRVLLLSFVFLLAHFEKPLFQLLLSGPRAVRAGFAAGAHDTELALRSLRPAARLP